VLKITTNFEVLGCILCLSWFWIMQRAYYTPPDVASEPYYRGLRFQCGLPRRLLAPAYQRDD
jgi:hypothetical protein